MLASFAISVFGGGRRGTRLGVAGPCCWHSAILKNDSFLDDEVGCRVQYVGCRRCRSDDCRYARCSESCACVLGHSCSPRTGMNMRYIRVPIMVHQCIIKPLPRVRASATVKRSSSSVRYARYFTSLPASCRISGRISHQEGSCVCTLGRSSSGLTPAN